MTWVTRRNNRHDKSHCDKGDRQTDSRDRHRGGSAVFASSHQPSPILWRRTLVRGAANRHRLGRGIATIARSRNACPMCWPVIAARATSIHISPLRAGPRQRHIRRIENGTTARPLFDPCRRAAQFHRLDAGTAKPPFWRAVYLLMALRPSLETQMSSRTQDLGRFVAELTLPQIRRKAVPSPAPASLTASAF